MSPTGSLSRTGGVPTFTVEAPGPRRAVLAFRVGRCDEPLPKGGLTHLVEHLALLPFQEQRFQYGGVVEGARTLFWVEGSDDEIRHFFSQLSGSLSNLPLDRLTSEARLLETEARSRKGNVLDILLNLRYGASGWGNGIYPEYALLHPSPELVREWAARNFTTGNAALGLSGPVDAVPLELHPGSRQPPPALSAIASLQTPAWFHQRQAGIGIGMVAPRSIRFATLLRLLSRRGRARLRFDESLSYEVSFGTLRLNDGATHGVLWADGLQENMSKVWTGLLEVIDKFKADGPTEQELQEQVESLRKDMENPAWPHAELDRMITNELLGSPTESSAELLASLERITPRAYQDLLDEVFSTAIAVVPSEVAVLDHRFTAVPIWSSETAIGREYRLEHPSTPVQEKMARLVISDSALSLVSGPGQVVTIPFDECQAVLHWDDGSRTLFSRDSFRLHVRPADWRGGSGLSELIDRHLKRELAVPMGPRPNPDPESLSKPVESAGVSPRRRRSFNWRRAVIAGTLIIAFYVLAAVLRSVLGGG